MIENFTSATRENNKLNEQTLLKSAAWLIFSIFAILTLRYQFHLLSYSEWGDEAETIVAAKMMAAGSDLYSGIFSHHGPLTFLPGLLLESFGNFGVRGHRVPIAILQLASLVAIYFSPILNGSFIRSIYTGLAASAMMLYFPDYYGFSYTYQVIASFLLIVILAQYTLPAIICPQRISAKQIIIGSILIGSLPFLAITYLPISILLFGASIRSQYRLKSFRWLIVGISLNLLFLIYAGSVRGYLAFHIYLNAEILPYYTELQGGAQLIFNAFTSATKDLSQFVTLSIVVIAIANMASYEKGFPWRSALIGLGTGSLLIRGVELHGLPYSYASLAFPMVFFRNHSQASPQSIFISSFLVIVCFVKLSLLIPADSQRLDSRRLPETTEFSQLAQLLTSKDERIIAYSFQNHQYIAADRLPASGNFSYLPWQEKYNETPKFGIKIDSCSDIDKYRPKIMLIDKWKVWDKFPWESYAGCIQKIVDIYYTQVLDLPYYVRNDISISDMGLTAIQGAHKMQASPQLNIGNPIKLWMTSGHLAQKVPLKKIGVMFGIYARLNSGDAELQLRGPNGASFTQVFSVSDLSDNKYKYFYIDSRQYTEGEIVSVSGGGVSTWENHDEKTGTQTCITYEYADGTRRFTAGCPLF